jgi:hypothetical protein
MKCSHSRYLHMKKREGLRVKKELLTVNTSGLMVAGMLA